MFLDIWWWKGPSLCIYHCTGISGSLMQCGETEEGFSTEKDGGGRTWRATVQSLPNPEVSKIVNPMIYFVFFLHFRLMEKKSLKFCTLKENVLLIRWRNQQMWFCTKVAFQISHPITSNNYSNYYSNNSSFKEILVAFLISFHAPVFTRTDCCSKK